MGYSAWYTDETGKRHKVSITEEESIEAVKNDYGELMKRYAPNIVRIERLKALEGEMLRLYITVKALSHYLTSPTDTIPKRCTTMSFYVVVYYGYPLVAVKVFYPPDHYLASPNVFRHGHACIDTWKVFTSSLLTAVDKVIHDIVHDPCVTIYNPPANGSMVDWHKKGVKERRFPTIETRHLYRRELS